MQAHTHHDHRAEQSVGEKSDTHDSGSGGHAPDTVDHTRGVPSTAAMEHHPIHPAPTGVAGHGPHAHGRTMEEDHPMPGDTHSQSTTATPTVGTDVHAGMHMPASGTDGHGGMTLPAPGGDGHPGMLVAMAGGDGHAGMHMQSDVTRLQLAAMTLLSLLALLVAIFWSANYTDLRIGAHDVDGAIPGWPFASGTDGGGASC